METGVAEERQSAVAAELGGIWERCLQSGHERNFDNRHVG